MIVIIITQVRSNLAIDEFHHAAPPSYQELLEYCKPKVLLGLTATPERADGRSIYTYFQGRVAAEIRLWEAIELFAFTGPWYPPGR